MSSINPNSLKRTFSEEFPNDLPSPKKPRKLNSHLKLNENNDDSQMHQPKNRLSNANVVVIHSSSSSSGSTEEFSNNLPYSKKTLKLNSHLKQTENNNGLQIHQPQNRSSDANIIVISSNSSSSGSSERNSFDSEDLSQESFLDSEIEDALNLLVEEDPNPDPLMKLLQNKSLVGLSEKNLDYILEIVTGCGFVADCDFVKSCDVVPLILELIKLELSTSQYATIFNQAIFENNLNLVKAILERCPLEVLKKNKTMMYIENQIMLNRPKEIIDYLYSISVFSKEDSVDLNFRKNLANAWEIEEGKFILKSETIKYGGLYLSSILDSFLECLTDYGENKITGHYLPRELLKVLQDSLNLSKRAVDVSEKFKQYQSGNKIILHSGLEGHLIDYVFIGNRLMVCNQGLFARLPITGYLIDPQYVTANIFGEIIRMPECLDDKLVEKYLFKNLLDELAAESDPFFENLFQSYWREKSWEQTASNCVIKSTQMSLSAIAATHFVEKQENSSQVVSLEPILDEMNKLHKFFPYWMLEKYLNYTEQNPERCDHELLSKIFSLIKINTPAPWICKALPNLKLVE